MSDTEVIEKAKGTMAKIVLVFMVTPITLASIGYLFSTVISNKESLAVIANGMDKVVISMERNTQAIVEMDKDNVSGHNSIATMVYGVKLAVAKSTVRIDNIAIDLEKSVEHMEKHEELIPKFEAWKSKIEIGLDDCKDSLKECEDKLKKIEHK